MWDTGLILLTKLSFFSFEISIILHAIQSTLCGNKKICLTLVVQVSILNVLVHVRAVTKADISYNE